MKHSVFVLVVLVMSSLAVSRVDAYHMLIEEGGQAKALSQVEASFERAKQSAPHLRAFLKSFPKGGDLHNHLVGAIYAESYIGWASEDGLCINELSYAIEPPEAGQPCGIHAAMAMKSGPVRANVINALSMRNFKSSADWSGHDQFFSTFDKMYYANFYRYGKGPLRSGDMLAEVAARAEDHNLAYLELLHTMELGSILAVVPPELKVKGQSVEALYNTLMDGPFGKALPTMVSNARAHLDLAIKRKNDLLNCDSGSVGCDVKILFLHQVIREFPEAQVFAQLILGAELAKADHRMVGLNMVAPEDGFLAMADYERHMQMVGFLWGREQEAGKELNVSLHAGELTHGLVPPEGLLNHIRSAVEVAHAKRIGHGIDIAHEANFRQLLQAMASGDVMVEINLSSNDFILGVKGPDHPYALYKEASVPMAISTDDEGVSRIDITHEYMRVVTEQGASYGDLLELSRNSLAYSFIPGDSLWENKAVPSRSCADDLKSGQVKPSSECAIFLSSSTKASMQWKLEQAINQFERNIVSNGK